MDAAKMLLDRGASIQSKSGTVFELVVNPEIRQQLEVNYVMRVHMCECVWTDCGGCAHCHCRPFLWVCCWSMECFFLSVVIFHVRLLLCHCHQDYYAVIEQGLIIMK